jgi:hypothetical protein
VATLKTKAPGPLLDGHDPFNLAQLRQRFLSRIEFGDALLLIYLIAIVRQWFWILDNVPAWTATIALAIACWCIYVLTKDPINERPRLSYWLIVGLPLLAAYVLRAPFPDSSFDVWGLRLFHGERGLRGYLYWPGEFFPTAAPFNPTPDMVTGIFRHVLGYRLGTVVNLLALIWAGTILDRLLRSAIANPIVRAVGVLLILFVEHLLFEINNYMPDLLALPILLEATRLTLDSGDRIIERRVVVRAAFLVGMAVTLKLSNGAVAMPLVLAYLWRLSRTRPVRLKQLTLTGLLSVLVVVLQLLPFTLWVYKLTGSPIFPLYNKVFRSPLYPPFNGWDNRWGGYGVFEILLWPVLMFFEPVRTAELPVYSGRLSVGFFVACLCLLIGRRLDTRTLTLAFILVLGSLLWSVTMGYIRYGLYLEVLSGILIVVLAAILYRRTKTKGPIRYGVGGLVALLSTLLVIQSIVAGFYLLQREWSMRPTIFDAFDAYKRETKNLLSDRSIRRLLPQRERELFDGVNVWIVSGAKTVGLMPLLNDQAKVVGVRAAGLFLAPGTREALGRSLDGFRGQKMASLALPSDYGEALFALRNVNLDVGRIEEIVIPFFSPDDRVPAYFFEVTRDDLARPEPSRTVCETILPENALQASITPLLPTIDFKAGQSKTVFFRVQNSSGKLWPSQGSKDDKYQIAFRGRWLASGGSRPVGGTSEVTLPYDFASNDSTILPLILRAPDSPGQYLLEFDMGQRGVSSFGEKGSKPLQVLVRIEP